MRVLFATLASVGHAYPLIPLAVAAREAGHEVHVAAGEAVHAPLAAHGLRPFGPADAFSELYAEDLEPELARLRPELVVHGWGVPEAAVAARRAGIPSLWHGFGRMFPAGIGLDRPTDDRPHLDICPPSLQDKEFTADRIALRPVPFTWPPSTWDRPTGPLIYLTLGTAFGTAELLTTVIEGLAALNRTVVVATGRVRPQELGVVPDGVTVHAWVPQTEVLAHADVVVHHGGSGTTLGALAAGAPQLVLPLGADQFANADALTGAGAAVALRPEEVSPEAVTAQVRRLLADREFATAARGIAEEIGRMPSPVFARQLPEHAQG